jgi:hypothetical protein
MKHVILTALLLAPLAALHAADMPADKLPPLPVDFGPCPRKLDEFLKYIVQRRAAEGLNRIVLSENDPRFGAASGDKKSKKSKKDLRVGTVYGGRQEDANIAWVAAAAYRYPWSRFHRNEILRQRAFFLMDSIARIRADGKWDDGGLDAYFGPQSFGWAALSWIETGDVDAPRAAVWREAVAKAADDGLVCLHYGPYRPSQYTGQYANPEMYFLSGLAAAWKLTGQGRYRDEAAKALRRYDAWLFDGGGVAYFLESSPQHGYQQMVVKSVALYWDLTGDDYALTFLKRLAPYFPNVQHRSGLITGAEQPHLKHTRCNQLNPGTAALIACALGDGANRRAADIATPLTADVVDQKTPSVKGLSGGWYNYHATTYAAAALRMMERHPLPAPSTGISQRVFPDASFRGVRSHWDDFTAAVGTRQMNDSLAGAYLADPKGPVCPLAAAVDGVYFEVLQGKPKPQGAGVPPKKPDYRCVEWSPTTYHLTREGFAAVSCLSRLCAPYWGNMPSMAGELGSTSGVSDWTSLQHWAVWRDCLIGLGSLRCHAAGGDPQIEDVARVRWRLAPAGRELEVLELTPQSCRFRYGGLEVVLLCLDEKGGFAFRPEEVSTHTKKGVSVWSAWTPLLVRKAPWAAGDFVNVATIIRPVKSQAGVQVKALSHGAAAVLSNPGDRKVLVWTANLWRHWEQYMLDLPPGVKVRTAKRDVEMPPVPPGEPASVGLLGGESALWEIESDTSLDLHALLDKLRAGKGRVPVRQEVTPVHTR